jgi:hypothetical protein
MFFKKKIEFAAAMRLALSKSFSGTWGHAMTALKEQGVLPTEEIDRLEAELPVLETVLWLLRFLETAATKRVAVNSSDEFIGLFGAALQLALQDGGLPECEVGKSREELMDKLEDFEEAFTSAARRFGPTAALLLGMPADQSSEGTVETRVYGMREPFGLACAITARRVAPGLVFTNETDVERWSALFHILQQVNERQAKGWAMFLARYSLVNR